MKKLSLCLGLFLISMMVFAGGKKDEDILVEPEANIMSNTLYTLSEEGLDQEIGTITVTDSPNGGIAITVTATNLIPGEHGFHLHEKNDLSPVVNLDGSVIVGGMAGGHWDPDNTGIHAGPNGNGHRGDLPFITVAPDGSVDMTVEVSRINLDDIAGRAFMVHVGADNYADAPVALGGGGARLYASPF